MIQDSQFNNESHDSNCTLSMVICRPNESSWCIMCKKI